MYLNQAVEELFFQSARHNDIDNSRYKNGFVELLRQNYLDMGLIEENFYKIVKIIFILRNEFEKQQINKEIMACILAIQFQGAQLSATSSITNEEIIKIQHFIHHILCIVFLLLDGCGVDVAFDLYK